MLLRFDMKVAEAKLNVDSLCSEIDTTLKKTLKQFKNLVDTLKKTEEKPGHRNCVWLCEMRYLSTAHALTEL